MDEALTEERTRNATVVDTLLARVADAGVLIERQRVIIAELKMRVSGLKGDKAYLRAEVDHRESVISSLRDTVRAREAELVALRDEPDAEVHTMPRRVFAEHEPTVEETLTAEDLWTDGSHPTVVDLKTLDLAMVLPNYEEDRQRRLTGLRLLTSHPELWTRRCDARASRRAQRSMSPTT